jgi:N-acetylglucosaminyldiphosphoundecaprenol N-acetyl-beta-D-mannosaminyltransferase
LSPETVRILGVPVENVDERWVLQFVAERVDQRRTTQIATINAEYVMRARHDPEFKCALEDADLRTPDGAGILLAARRRRVRIPRRVGGSDLVWSISEQAGRLGHRIFLLGGAETVAARAAGILTQEYPSLVICGAHAGSPRHDDDLAQTTIIREARPDILLVAFGAPDQDLWLARMKSVLNVPVVVGVGGSLDYVAGVATRAPRWMQDAGLEWLFRLIRQPWRWKRMMVLPAFALLAAARSD